MIDMYKSLGMCLILMLIATGVAIAGNDVLATGDGIVVYTQDVDVIKDAYGSSGFQTNPKEYMDAMLKVRLFAKEALALKLGGPLTEDEAVVRAMQTGNNNGAFSEVD